MLDHRASKISLAVLDFGQTYGQQTSSEVIRSTMAHAHAAELLGFHRYWLAEHHESTCAWAAPEILVGIIAAHSERIRVGTAGILLPLQSPIKVAEVFALMSSMHPTRIDLGIAGGTADPAVKREYLPPEEQTARVADIFDRKLTRLLQYLSRDSEDEDSCSVRVLPVDSIPPEVWLLGARRKSLRASQEGLHFSYSLLHRNSSRDPSHLHTYFAGFRPSRFAQRPKANIAVNVACAGTYYEAVRIASLTANSALHTPLCGTATECAEQILALADKYSVQEVVIKAEGYLPEQRLFTYAAIAEELNIRREGVR